MTRMPTAARWPAGVALTSWAYMWRITPMHRDEVEGSLPEDLPPELPPTADLDGVQRVDEGVGPLFHRLYSTRIRDGRLSAAELIETVAADPDKVAPGEFTSFQKKRGDEGGMRVGDEFLVRMPGPWDGPVRVVDVTATSFRFATLEGHLEAGQIEWRAHDERDALVFEIESWARGGDQLSYVLHDRLKMAKEVQLHMWTSVLERVARRSGGRLDSGIDVQTRRVELDDAHA